MKKKRSMKRFAATALLMLTALSLGLAACSSGGDGDVTVWTTDSVTKVLQTGEYEIPAQSPQLNIGMAKNEKEGAQIILTANEKIDYYDAEVSNLYNGAAVIPASDVQLYAEKYITIASKQNTNTDFPPGSRVPDALLPMETSVYYKENNIEAGNNQGIYVEVTTAEDTPAGVYTGTVTVTAEHTVYEIPLRVEVWDFAISSTPSAMNYLSLFAREAWGSYELDSTDEMAAVYFEKLLEYRMNTELPFSGVGGTERYVELLRKYYDHPGFSSYRFYYQLVGNGNMFDTGLLQEYLEAVVGASMEDKVNYLDKAFFYFCNLIDEPNSVGSYQTVQTVQTMYEIVLRATDSACRAKYSASPDYGYYLSVVSPTLMEIPNILTLTNSNAHQILKSEYGVEGITYCPLVNLFETENSRDGYYTNEIGEVWWYTAMVPLYPYPSNHLDDYALSYRIMSWMQKAYDVDGYLMWAVANYSSNNFDMPTDPYEDATRGDAFPPGDGFMFYPGAKYGIKGPVGSLRAVAYRDGMEDYEYLVELEKGYQSRNMDPAEIMNSFYERLFTNVTPINSSASFGEVREEVGELIASMNSDFGVLYEEIQIRGASANVTFNTVNAAAEVSYNGSKLALDPSGKYSVTVDLTETNVLELVITCNGAEQTVTRRLSGQYALLEGFESGNTDFIEVHSTSRAEINKDAQYIASGENSLKLTLTGRPDVTGYRPFFAISRDDLRGGDLTQIEHITLAVFNPSGENITLSLNAFIGSQYMFVDEYTLAPGINYLQVKNVYALRSLSAIQGFYFMTDNFEGEKVLYVDDVACTLM